MIYSATILLATLLCAVFIRRKIQKDEQDEYDRLHIEWMRRKQLNDKKQTKNQ